MIFSNTTHRQRFSSVVWSQGLFESEFSEHLQHLLPIPQAVRSHGREAPSPLCQCIMSYETFSACSPEVEDINEAVLSLAIPYCFLRAIDVYK